MKYFPQFAILFPALLLGCATNPTSTYLYFPDLAQRAASGEVAALKRALSLSDTTSPGEQLEELAEILSKSVRPYPSAFLSAQMTEPRCYGVNFMGPAYVDNQSARNLERALRRAALMSVTDPSLAEARMRCIAVLKGS